MKMKIDFNELRMDKIRTVNKTVSLGRKIIYSILIFIFGAGIGLLSKALDETPVNELPYLMQRLDITNFLGRFSIWIFIAVCISIYSVSAKRASLNVFLFFIAMVSSYYLYSSLAAGFFPKSYALIWFCITAISPLLAYVCWYGKGKGWFSIVISGIIIGILLSQAIFFTQGIRIAYIPELLVWLASLWVLRRKLKEFAIAVGISIPVAIIIQLFVPYWG